MPRGAATDLMVLHRACCCAVVSADFTTPSSLETLDSSMRGARALYSATGPQANAQLRPASAASRTTVETMCMNSSDVGRRLSKRGASGAREAWGVDADTFE